MQSVDGHGVQRADRLLLKRANPSERRGRKVTGLREAIPRTAGLPAGWLWKRAQVAGTGRPQRLAFCPWRSPSPRPVTRARIGHVACSVEGDRMQTLRGKGVNSLIESLWSLILVVLALLGMTGVV